MPIRKLYLGDQGPFYYDDEVPIDDPDGDFAGELQHAILTEGGLKIGGVEYATKFIDVVTNVTAETQTITVVTQADPEETEEITFVTGINVTLQNIRTFES